MYLPNIILSLVLLVFTSVHARMQPAPVHHVLATEVMPLDDRYPVPSVSDVFKDNILLTLGYMRGSVHSGNVDWNSVEKPFHYQITLKQGQVFAFHNDVLPQFDGKVVATTGAHFNSQEGFKSDGYLVGDGVCHLASIINFAAQKAGLATVAPTNHDFANIPDVPRQYGVAIYSNPEEPGANAMQNLYVTNNTKKDIAMVFDYSNNDLKVTIEQL